MVVLGGGAVSYERGAPVHVLKHGAEREARRGEIKEARREKIKEFVPCLAGPTLLEPPYSCTHPISGQGVTFDPQEVLGRS